MLRASVPARGRLGYTKAMIDRAVLAAVPAAAVPRSEAIARAVDDSVHYLASDAAIASLAVDAYWPKWHSPWWHMLLLHELGEHARIPARVVDAMHERLARVPHHFALPPEQPTFETLCHCAVGSMYQILRATGVDVDRTCGWMIAWFDRYQMADGGYNCDETAYAVTDECASSMVGTVALFEAMVLHDARSPAATRAAQFLIGRRLTEGSASRHNAEERAAAPRWGQPTFPRFYFYDVIRGLAALVRWAEATDATLPAAAVAVASELAARFPDGVVPVERQAFTQHGTWLPAEPAPRTRQPALRSPLLDATSAVGAPSEALTRQWTAARQGLLRRIDAGKIV